MIAATLRHGVVSVLAATGLLLGVVAVAEVIPSPCSAMMFDDIPPTDPLGSPGINAVEPDPDYVLYDLDYIETYLWLVYGIVPTDPNYVVPVDALPSILDYIMGSGN